MAEVRDQYALRAQMVHQNMLARREARLEQIQTLRQEHLAMISQRLQQRAMLRGALGQPSFGGFGANSRLAALKAQQLTVVGVSTPAGPLANASNSMTMGSTVVWTPTSTATGAGGLANPSAGASTPTILAATTGDTGAGVNTSTTGSNGQTISYNPTSPNDFPYGPGGFFEVVQTPDGGMIGFL